MTQQSLSDDPAVTCVTQIITLTPEAQQADVLEGVQGVAQHIVPAQQQKGSVCV